MSCRAANGFSAVLMNVAIAVLLEKMASIDDDDLDAELNAMGAQLDALPVRGEEEKNDDEHREDDREVDREVDRKPRLVRSSRSPLQRSPLPPLDGRLGLGLANSAEVAGRFAAIGGSGVPSSTSDAEPPSDDASVCGREPGRLCFLLESDDRFGPIDLQVEQCKRTIKNERRSQWSTRAEEGVGSSSHTA